LVKWRCAEFSRFSAVSQVRPAHSLADGLESHKKTVIDRNALQDASDAHLAYPRAIDAQHVGGLLGREKPRRKRCSTHKANYMRTVRVGQTKKPLPSVSPHSAAVQQRKARTIMR
jgi:hypothetical protein